MSERRPSSGPHDGSPGRRTAGNDPCGIRRALAEATDERWQDFFAQWCRATEMGPVAARHVRDVAARLAQPAPSVDDGDDVLPGAWAAVRDAMDRSMIAPGAAPPLEASG